jgi:hypothetical protein
VISVTSVADGQTEAAVSHRDRVSNRAGCCRLPRRQLDGGYSDRAIVPIAAETAASRQFVVAEPFSAKVPDSHAAAKVEEGIVRTDCTLRGRAGHAICQQVCWQMGENMLFDVPADQLRDLRPSPFRQGIERIRVARAWT